MDWRTASVDDVKVDMAELRNQLVPTLRSATLPRGKEIAAWASSSFPNVATCSRSFYR